MQKNISAEIFSGENLPEYVIFLSGIHFLPFDLNAIFCTTFVQFLRWPLAWIPLPPGRSYVHSLATEPSTRAVGLFSPFFHRVCDTRSCHHTAEHFACHCLRAAEVRAICFLSLSVNAKPRPQEESGLLWLQWISNIFQTTCFEIMGNYMNKIDYLLSTPKETDFKNQIQHFLCKNNNACSCTSIAHKQHQHNRGTAI